MKDGVKLLGDGAISEPIDVEVTRASKSAIEALEATGGSVVSVYMNRLALRAHLKPEKFIAQPKIARPPPRLMAYYLDYSKRGYLAPEIQLKKQLRKLGLPER